MRAVVESICTSCGLCAETCPEVFQMGDEIAEVVVGQIPPQFEDLAIQACEECPVEAISIE